MRSKEFEFPRQLVLQERINAGKKVEGLRGFVPTESKCCSGNTTFYIPVLVRGIKFEGCEFAVQVECLADDIVCSTKAASGIFQVKTESFFQSKEEIQRYEDFRRRKSIYKEAMNPMEYHQGTLRRKRTRFKEAVQARLDKNANDALALDIQNEMNEDGINCLRRRHLRLRHNE